MKPKRTVYLLVLVIASMLVTSCQNRPKEVLNRKKMERLMYDVYVAEATMETDYQNFDSPEKKEVYINEVFRAHDVNQARWDTSLSWYSDRIDLYLRMNDSVKARLKRAQVHVDTQVAQQSLQQSSFNPSRYPASYVPSYYLFALPDVRNGFRFRLDSTDIATKIGEDSFYFSFKAVGVPPAFDHKLTALLTLVYGDTTIHQYRQVTENREYRIPASKIIDNDTLVRLNGFIHLQHSGEVVPNIQLYDVFLGTELPDTIPSIDANDSTIVLTDSIQSHF